MIPVPMPALDTLRAIDAGTLTAAAAFESHVEWIAGNEAVIGAFAHLALEAARFSHPHRAAAGPLKGLPVGVKDIFDTADMPTEYGTEIYRGNRPAADAAIVALTRRAGGSVIGKTVTTPLANLDPAATRNPRAPGHTPGGSSSGSAAAGAAGFAPFAIGTQTGGSTIRPAAYCGIAGYKPSFKLLPATGMKSFSWNLDTVGLFAPRVADAAFFAEALTGRPLRVDGEAEALPRRVGLLGVPDPDLAEPAMQAALARACRALEAQGVEIVDLGAPEDLKAAWEVHATLQNYEAARALAFDLDRHGERIPPLVKADLVAGTAIAHADYDAARGIASRSRKAAGRLFERVDIVLQPAAPGAPPEGLGSTGRALFNRLWTMTGDPAVTVSGLADDLNRPLGLQVTGPFGEDRRTLAHAHAIERLIARL